jgi:hypothetical protein
MTETTKIKKPSINLEGARCNYLVGYAHVTTDDGMKFIKSACYPFNWERQISGGTWRKVSEKQRQQLQGYWDVNYKGGLEND